MSVGPIELLLILMCCGVTFGVPTAALIFVLLRRSRQRSDDETSGAQSPPDA